MQKSNEFVGLMNKLGKVISISLHKQEFPSGIQGAQFSCKEIPI